jgi:hypothetical protein
MIQAITILSWLAPMLDDRVYIVRKEGRYDPKGESEKLDDSPVS